MDKIYCNLELDFSENKSLKVIKVKQFESQGKRIILSLYNNGKEFIFSGLETAVINANVNGTVTAYEETCTVSAEDNYITIPLYPSLTTLAGNEHCEVKITSYNNIIYTATFIINVEPSVATSESAAVLKTTELAATLSGLDSRVTVLENDSTDVEEYIDTAKSAIIDKIDNAKTDINDNIDTAKNSLSSQMTSNLLSIDIWLTNVQTALSEEVEDVREEFEDKYDELLYEMKKSEKAILQEIKSLADELAVGNSVIAGPSTLLMQGGVSQSYAGTITGGDN